MMKHEKLLAKLNKFNANDTSCKKVYCTTCGGLAHAIRSKITPELNKFIEKSLSEMSIQDFNKLGEWAEYLKNNYPLSVRSIYERESNNIDTSNIRQLDGYLFYSRKVMRNSPIYNSLLNHGIQAAIESSNDSLIETVAIILGDKILDYNDLFKLALKKSETNKNIHRVLYNSLRDKVPQVRNFVGDGTTSMYGW